MTKLTTSNIIVFPSSRARLARMQVVASVRPVPHAVWHVSPASGKLECAWIDADDPNGRPSSTF